MTEARSRAWGTAVGYVLVLSVLIGGWSLFEPVRVAGGSMRPALAEGDIAIVRRGGAHRRGDIVLVREAGRSAVLHRVVATHGAKGAVRLKGDANPVDDLEDVAARDVAGPVVRVIPFGAVFDGWRVVRGMR